MPEPEPTFERELESLINRFSQERFSNTPDFILAAYLLACLAAWNAGVTRREEWYGRPSGMITAGMITAPVRVDPV
jgi:hypothetical protein